MKISVKIYFILFLITVLVFLPIIPVKEAIITGYTTKNQPSKYLVENSYLTKLTDSQGREICVRCHVIIRNIDNRNIILNIEFLPKYSNGFPVKLVVEGYTIKTGELKDAFYDFTPGYSVISLFGSITRNDYKIIDGSSIIIVPLTEEVIEWKSIFQLITQPQSIIINTH